MQIPIEWQYKNILSNIGDVSPYSFELYENSVGAFQISCYPISDRKFDPSILIQKSNTRGLEFTEQRLDDDDFNCHLWLCIVEDHFILAKYIYDSNPKDLEIINKELKKAKTSLSTVEFLSSEKRVEAFNLNKCKEFLAAIAASFDLKNNAFKNNAFIELIILTANQIDAYLRFSLMMKKQIDNKINDIDITLIYQGDKDAVISEREIYNKAKENNVISEELFNKLQGLYNKRNKIVHRYIISDIKTKDLIDIAYSYEVICNEVQLKLKEIEDFQMENKIGVYGNWKDLNKEYTSEDINYLMSQVNDKHFLDALKRSIS